MSLQNVKQSIFALPMLTTAAIASLLSISIAPSSILSQVEQATDSSEVVAYRASGRFDTGSTLAYRASGRFSQGMEDTIAYRGSERGIGPIAYRASGRLSNWGDLISYRASGRFEHFMDGLAYRGSERGVEAIAYRASGRFETGFDEVA